MVRTNGQRGIFGTESPVSLRVSGDVTLSVTLSVLSKMPTDKVPRPPDFVRLCPYLCPYPFTDKVLVRRF
jgi:hypothetical protein